MKKQLLVVTLAIIFVLGICGSASACETQKPVPEPKYTCGDNQNTNHCYTPKYNKCHKHYKHHKHHKHHKCCHDDSDDNDDNNDIPTSI